MFLVKGVLKICSKFTKEHPYQSEISAMNKNLPLMKHKSSAFTYLNIIHSKYNYTIHICKKCKNPCESYEKVWGRYFVKCRHLSFLKHKEILIGLPMIHIYRLF